MNKIAIAVLAIDFVIVLISLATLFLENTPRGRRIMRRLDNFVELLGKRI